MELILAALVTILIFIQIISGLLFFLFGILFYLYKKDPKRNPVFNRWATIAIKIFLFCFFSTLITGAIYKAISN